MKKVTLIVLTVLITAGAFADDSDVTGFRQHSWGNSMESFGKLVKVNKKFSITPYRKVKEDLAFLGRRAKEIHYDFDESGFLGASVYYLGDEKMCGILEKKLNSIYGKWNDRKEGKQVYYWEKISGDVTLDCEFNENPDIIAIDFDYKVRIEPKKKEPKSGGKTPIGC